MPARARDRRLGHPEVFAGFAALSFLVARFVPVLSLPFVCPARAMLGIPCATCGMTHAFVALARGDLGGAWHESPFGAVLAAATWGYALADALRLAAGRPFPSLPDALLRAVTAGGLAALLVNWAWLLAR